MRSPLLARQGVVQLEHEHRPETSNTDRDDSGASATGFHHSGWQRVKRAMRTVLGRANQVLEAVACSISSSGPIKLLNALQSVVVIIAVTSFLVDNRTRHEERLARRLTAVSNAYSIIAEVSRSASTSGQRTRSRRQMIALEELHRYSTVEGGRYLAQLDANSVRFNLTRNTYRSGCDERHDPGRVVLRRAYFDRAVLYDTSFVMADLSGAHFRFAELMRANFFHACLRMADLRNGNLEGALLHNADLSRANLSFANLQRAYLVGADLSYADLSFTNLANANLRGANLSNATLEGAKGLIQSQLDVACIRRGGSEPRKLPNGLRSPQPDRSCGD